MTDLDVPVPPNARIETLVLDDAAGALQLTVRGETAERTIARGAIAALHGARIRHESESIHDLKRAGIDFGKLAITAATGVPVGVTKGGQKQRPTVSEDLVFALALRAADSPEVLYLVAASFNFRKALGADATYSTEANLRALVRRLSAFAPHAAKDAFFEAVTGATPLPPPLTGLRDLFRLASPKT